MLAAMFPPIPGVESLHPLVIHFPIGLLLVSPIFLILGMVFPARGRMFGVAALILMAVGTVGIFAAVYTGERAGELAERNPEVNVLLEEHAEMAESARILFAILTVVYAAALIVPRFLPVLRRPRVHVPVHGAFLVIFLAGGLLLANTAHRGGRLVHQYGVHALIVEPPPAVPD